MRTFGVGVVYDSEMKKRSYPLRNSSQRRHVLFRNLCGTMANAFVPSLGTRVFPIRAALCMITLSHLLRFILPSDQIRFLGIRQIFLTRQAFVHNAQAITKT